MSSDRSHLVPQMRPGKNGPVLRYVNPDKENPDGYMERQRAMREQVLNRAHSNIPPGTQRYVDMANEFRDIGRKKNSYIRAAEKMETSIRLEFEGKGQMEFEWGSVKVGKPAKLFNSDDAARSLTPDQFRELSKPSYLNGELMRNFPDVYESCSEQDEDRPLVNIYTKGGVDDDSYEKLPIKTEGSLKERIEMVDKYYTAANRISERRDEIRETFMEDFDPGITDLGDTVVDFTYHRNVDWDAAEKELGNNIKVCQSRKLNGKLAKEVMGDDWYQSHRTGSRAAGLSYSLY